MTRRLIGAVAVALAASLLLSSCQLVNSITGPILDRYPNDIVKVATDRGDQIIDLLKKHDAAGLKSLFSPEAIASAPDLQSGMDDAFTVFTGKLAWADNNNEYPAEFKYSGPDGEYRKYFLSYCADFADGRQYLIFFLYYLQDTVDPNLVGLYSVRIKEKPGWCTYDTWSETDPDETATYDPSHEIAGVTVQAGGTS